MAIKIRLLLWDDVDAFSTLLQVIEIHNTVFDSEKGVIAPALHIHPGVYLRTALADEDITDDHSFTTEFFNTKPLGMTIPSVST